MRQGDGIIMGLPGPGPSAAKGEGRDCTFALLPGVERMGGGVKK